MEQQKLSRRNGIIGIALMALAALTAAAFFIIGVGKWLFYLSFAFFFVGSIITTGNEDEPSVTQ
jgi:predicted tellurium resistance membrane protein TerC